MKRAIFIGMLLFSAVASIYLYVAGGLQWKLEKTNVAYFNLLAESFLQRRYDLIHPPANPFDLAVYKGAVYVPWGPLPAIFIMPLVKVFGIGVSDRIYTAFFGGLNVFIFYFLLVQWNRLRKNYSFWQPIFLALFFAFGTVQFSVSTVGQVWFTSQVLSLTPFLISLLFLFKGIEKKNFLIFICSLFFYLFAFMGKIWYIALAPTYIYGYWVSRFSVKEHIRIVIVGFLLLVFLGRTYGMYNYRRFGSVWETGYSYQKQAKQFQDAQTKYGRYHWRYISKNVWYEFMKPVSLINGFKPNPYGNGLFFTSPLFLLLFMIPRVKKIQSPILFFVPSIFLYSIQVIGFFGTGYYQFGHRYLLEIIPLLILLLSIIIPSVSKKITIPLGILSGIFHSFGAYWLVMR